MGPGVGPIAHSRSSLQYLVHSNYIHHTMLKWRSFVVYN